MNRLALRATSSTWLGIFAVAALSGCSSEPLTGDENNQTSSKPVDVRFEVSGEIRGAVSSSSGAAQESWKAACTRFEKTLVEIAAPATVEKVDCGTTRQLVGGSVVELASTATATIVAKLPKDTAPASFEPGDVMAATKSNETDAAASWLETCEASLRQAKSLYGERLLAGSCGEAKSYIGGSVTGYRSTPTLWVAPARGDATDVAGFAQGAGSSEQIAHAAWRASCDAWLARTALLSGAEHLTSYSCGERKTVLGGSSWIVESQTSVELTMRLVDEAAPTVETFSAKGEELTSQTAANASAVAACELEIGKRKQALGERFLGGSCAGMKSLIGGSVHRFEVTGTVLSGDIAPIEEPAPDAEEPIEPSPVGPDPEQSQPAEGCTNRCLAMMDACDAGPRESTCESICITAPTEGELACAEQVACENIGDWFNVCSLGV